jgi:hypothetical protein
VVAPPARRTRARPQPAIEDLDVVEDPAVGRQRATGSDDAKALTQSTQSSADRVYSTSQNQPVDPPKIVEPPEKPKGRVIDEKALAEVREGMAKLIGLDDAKENFANLEYQAREAVWRAEQDPPLPVLPTNQHTVYAGPPGTGKSTFAKLDAKGRRALGLLKTPDEETLVRLGALIKRTQHTEEELKGMVGSELGEIAQVHGIDAGSLATDELIAEILAAEGEASAYEKVDVRDGWAFPQPVDGVLKVTPADLKAGYQGQTVGKVAALLKYAISEGAVLLIEEAYGLYTGEDDMYGREALGILMEYMEEYREYFAVFFCGYPDEINYLIDEGNPGMRSRLVFWDFPSYQGDELEKIMDLFLKEGADNVSDEDKKAVIAELDKRRNVKGFANARTVRSMLEQARLTRSGRIGKMLVEAKDDPSKAPTREQATSLTLDELMKGLDRAIQDRSDLIDEKDAAMAELVEMVNARQEAIEAREASVGLRESHVSQREQDVAVMNARIQELEAQVDELEKKLA